MNKTIEDLKGFPNQAVPAIYGESVGYTQQVAYLMFKIQQCIDFINGASQVEIPQPTVDDIDKVLQIAPDGEKVKAIWSNEYPSAIAQLMTNFALLSSGKQNEIFVLDGTLEQGLWVGNLQTVTVTGILPTDIIIVGPKAGADGSYVEYTLNDIRGYSQSTDTVTFQCSTVPSVNVDFQVMVIRPN